MLDADLAQQSAANAMSSAGAGSDMAPPIARDKHQQRVGAALHEADEVTPAPSGADGIPPPAPATSPRRGSFAARALKALKSPGKDTAKRAAPARPPKASSGNPFGAGSPVSADGAANASPSLAPTPPKVSAGNPFGVGTLVSTDDGADAAPLSAPTPPKVSAGNPFGVRTLVSADTDANAAPAAQDEPSLGRYDEM